MMVLLISRSTGKSQKTVRTILDSFAERIGDDAWRTVITSDGLEAVRTALRRNATKIRRFLVIGSGRGQEAICSGLSVTEASSMMQALYLLIRRKRKSSILNGKTTGSTCRLLKSWPVWRDFSRLGQSIGFLSKEAALRNERAGSVPSRMDELQDD